MRNTLVLLFGTMPAILLGLLAFVPLIAGFSAVLDYPSVGSLLIAWATAGIFGCTALLQAAGGRYGDNTTPGLLSGIAAAAPMVYVLADIEFPAILLFAYPIVGPILVALWFLAERLLFPPGDVAHTGLQNPQRGAPQFAEE